MVGGWVGCVGVLFIVLYVCILLLLMQSMTIFIGVILLSLFIVQIIMLFFKCQHLFVLFLLGIYVYFIFVIMSFVFFGKSYKLTFRLWSLYMIISITYILCFFIYFSIYVY